MNPFGFDTFAGRPRAHRGDMSLVILHVLSEKPMHGYEIIRTLEERSQGVWRPSAGSVYPTLQLLEEQGLVKAKEEDGKKVYHLTPAGKKATPKEWAKHAWAKRGRQTDWHGVMLKLRDLKPHFKEIMRRGTPEDMTDLKEILERLSHDLEELAAKDRP